MMEAWQELSLNTRRLLVTLGIISVIVLIGMQFHVSSQGDMSDTYPKGFRGGTCTIETDSLLIGFSAYLIPKDYEIPEDAMSALSVPVLCGKVPGPGMLDVTIDLLYPEAIRDKPLTLRLAKLEAAGNERDILSLPASLYRSGTISQALQLDQPGQYSLYIQGQNLDNQDFSLEMPIKVGTEWWEELLTNWPLVLILAGALFFYNFRRFVD